MVCTVYVFNVFLITFQFWHQSVSFISLLLSTLRGRGHRFTLSNPSLIPVPLVLNTKTCYCTCYTRLHWKADLRKSSSGCAIFRPLQAPGNRIRRILLMPFKSGEISKLSSTYCRTLFCCKFEYLWHIWGSSRSVGLQTTWSVVWFSVPPGFIFKRS